MSEEEIRNYLRKISHVGVPARRMAQDAGLHNQTISKLLSDQEMWRLRPETKEILEDYIDWFKSTLGLN